MLVQIVTENGQKKVIPLTADAGAGNPVGTIIPMYKKSSPSGYLYCDGSTFDETKYPLLYAYLGSNVLPDYREFALVGAEENTTDVYNASTNPNGTIHDHDVYTEGQAKDDQLQKIVYTPENDALNGWTAGGNLPANSPFTKEDSNYSPNAGQYGASIRIGFDSSKCTRSGDTTRGKRKAVYFYIKATSGLSENAQDNVVAQLNEERSYSTSEVNTGKKWIDGKPIYKKVIEPSSQLGNNSNAWVSTGVRLTDADTIIASTYIRNDPDYWDIISGMYLRMKKDTKELYYWLTQDGKAGYYIIIVEYTKTTDV